MDHHARESRFCDGGRGDEHKTALILCGLLAGVLLLAFVLYLRSPQARSAHPPGPTMLAAGPTGRLGGLTSVGIPPDQIGRRLLDAGARVGGEVEVSLAWNSLTDLDLSVRDPLGEIVSWRHRRSAGGGTLDVDANPTVLTAQGKARSEAGLNPGPENVLRLPDSMADMSDHADDLMRQSGWSRGAFGGDLPLEAPWRMPMRFTRRPVEHIYFSRAPAGTYTVYAHCYSWHELNLNPLPFTVQVRCRGRVIGQIAGVLGPANYITDNTAPAQVCEFMMR